MVVYCNLNRLLHKKKGHMFRLDSIYPTLVELEAVRCSIPHRIRKTMLTFLSLFGKVIVICCFNKPNKFPLCYGFRMVGNKRFVDR